MSFYENPDLAISVIKIFTLGFLGFIVAFLLTPSLTHFLYKHKLWRKKVRDKSLDGRKLPFFQKFHTEGETQTPRFGGILIWVTTLILAILFFVLSKTDIWWFEKLNFLSRSQTWLPLLTLVVASLLGLADDILQVFSKGKHIDGGLSLRYRLILVGFIGLIGAWWFFAKLGWQTIHIPGIGDFLIGAWYIPFFVFCMMATYSGGVIDGLDGLSGGTFATIFGAFAIISLWRGQIDLAAFCAVISGTILAFLWFNIPPARFYMGETGMLGLCTSLTVVAFLTDSVLVLPIIGFLLVIESGSVILQLLSKKFRHKKLFLAAPLHHHFEAKGWPSYKVTMRFWVIGVVMAFIGVAIRLLG
ncbi:MAG: phospho-N-acetylmuramoyl-pentapeptide-transferase [Candidatus Nealsonbacteria bacterium]